MVCTSAPRLCRGMHRSCSTCTVTITSSSTMELVARAWNALPSFSWHCFSFSSPGSYVAPVSFTVKFDWHVWHIDARAPGFIYTLYTGVVSHWQRYTRPLACRFWCRCRLGTPKLANTPSQQKILSTLLVPRLILPPCTDCPCCCFIGEFFFERKISFPFSCRLPAYCNWTGNLLQFKQTLMMMMMVHSLYMWSRYCLL